MADQNLDLDHMGNISVTLSTWIYAKNKNIITAYKLEIAVLRQWKNFHEITLKNLNTAIKNQACQVIRENG